jgi:hypothetical protein
VDPLRAEVKLRGCMVVALSMMDTSDGMATGCSGLDRGCAATATDRPGRPGLGSALARPRSRRPDSGRVGHGRYTYLVSPRLMVCCATMVGTTLLICCWCACRFLL